PTASKHVAPYPAFQL
ncbi:beta-eliminating lyase family protein, partial [Vibrio parahaemolyticus V-223/04]